MQRANALGMATVLVGAVLLAWAALPLVEAPSAELASLTVATDRTARFVLAALVLLALLLAVLRRSPRWGAAGAAVAVLALLVSLLPWFEARDVASGLGVPLSWKENLLGPPEPEVRVTENVPFTGAAEARRLDVYRPEGPGIRPAVVVVHGGAWVRGTKSELPGFDRWLAGEGFAVFDVEYRLSPAPNWKAAIGDVKCAVAFVRANAAEYGVDPSRIALLGRSAGGHLALIAAYSASNPQVPASCPGDGRVSAVVAYYAPIDLAWSYAHEANPRVMDGAGMFRRFLGGSPSEELVAYRLASPTTFAGPQAPPTLLFQGGRDQYVRPENTDRLDERLGASGVVHETVRLPWAQHGFDFAEGGWGDQIARHELRAFLARTLGNR